PSPRRRSGATLFLAPTPRLCNYGRGFMVFLDKRLAIGHRARVRQRSRAHAKLRSGRRGMISLRMVGTEVSALGAAALSMPLRFVVERDRFDPSSPYPTPVVLVHGLFGDPTNFLLLRRYLARRGMRNFAAFSYPPRLDYQRLAPRLGDLIYGPHSGPRQRGGQVVVVPECGHWGLLIHPAVMREAAGFLAFPGAAHQLAEGPLALDAAS